MSNENLSEKVIRRNILFLLPSGGEVYPQILWTVKLTTLNQIVVKLHDEINKAPITSFLKGDSNKVDDDLMIAFEYAKYVIETRQNEIVFQKKEDEKKKELHELFALQAEIEEKERKSLTKEEIADRIKALSASVTY